MTDLNEMEIDVSHQLLHIVRVHVEQVIGKITQSVLLIQ